MKNAAVAAVAVAAVALGAPALAKTQKTQKHRHGFAQAPAPAPEPVVRPNGGPQFIRVGPNGYWVTTTWGCWVDNGQGRIEDCNSAGGPR
jgi:hypothetical protein